MARINRRGFMGIAGRSLAVLAGGMAPHHPEHLLSAADYRKKPIRRSPNIVWLIADDMSPDIGCYGRKHVKTPSLDRLAFEGIHFTNMFANISSCSPCRVSFTTGRYPHSMDAGDMKIPLDEGIPILPTMLRPRGYISWNVGKFHLDGPTNPGIVKEAGHPLPKHGESQYDRCVGLHEWKTFFDQRPKDKPFFLTVGFYDPHRPYKPNAIPDPHDPAKVFVPPFLTDLPETRRDIAMYYDEISRMDRVIGAILDRLDKERLVENTIVIFFSDGGMPMLRCKTFVYDSGLRVPFIVRWPGRIRPGGVHHGLWELVDVVPTICEAAGVKPADGVHGQSMMAALSDPASPGKDYVYHERNWHDFDDHIRAVRSERFKYIINAYPDEPMQPTIDIIHHPATCAMRKLAEEGKLPPYQAVMFQPTRPSEELYDIKADPFELKNLAADPEFKEIRDELRRVLWRHTEQTAIFGPERRYIDGYDRNTGRAVPGEFRFPKLRSVPK